MKFPLSILWAISLFLSNAASAATILSVKKVDIAGAHGMTVLSKNEIFLADTFKSLDSSVSRIYQVAGTKLSAVNFQGLGLSGITPISTGYLICDLHASIVYKTNKSFEIKSQWRVQNPWVAKADTAGNILVLTYSGQLLSLKLNGGQEILISNLDAPFDFEFSPKFDGVWISEQGQHDGKVSFWKFDKTKKPKRVLDSIFPWKNPEGLLWLNGYLWVLDTEVGSLIKVSESGTATVALKGLGIPILIQRIETHILVYSNDYKGSPALLEIRP